MSLKAATVLKHPLLRYGLLLLLIAGLYILILDTQTVGFIQDDGVYAVTAKALAEGYGPRLPHLPTEPWNVRYPYVYPLILSVGWLFSGQAETALAIGMWLTLAFGLASFVLLFRYLKERKGIPTGLTLLILMLVATNKSILFYFTCMMSEAPYFFLSILTIFLGEKWLKQADDTQAVLPLKQLGILSLLSVLCFHTRVIGFCLILGLIVSLLLRKRYREAMLFGLPSILCSWVLWKLWVGGVQPKNLDGPLFGLMRGYSEYTELFQSLYSPLLYLKLFLKGSGGFLYNLLDTLFPWLTGLFRWLPISWTQQPLVNQLYDGLILLCSYGLLGFFLLPVIRWSKQGLSAAFTKESCFPEKPSLSTLYLILYALAILFWNYENQLPRFFSLISPWIWLSLLLPLYKQAVKIPVRRLILFGLIIFNTIGFLFQYQWVYALRQGHNAMTHGDRNYEGLWSEYQHTFAYIHERLPENQAIASIVPTTVYLYTQHPSYFIFFPSLRMRRAVELSPKEVEAAVAELMDSMDYYHIRYLMLEPQLFGPNNHLPGNLVAEQLLQQFPTRFHLRYHSPVGMIKLYDISPPQP